MSERPVTVARAFTLGVDIEEVYIVFGEALQLMTGGLMPDHYDAVERKAQRVRDALLDHGCPHDLVQQFERVAAAIHRAGDPLVGGLEGLHHETMAATHELDAVMVGVRGQLGDDDARLYDLGIMLARLHLCLRVVTPPAGDPERVELYRTELARVVPSSLDMLAESEAAGLLGRAMSAELEELLRRVNDELLRWDGGSDAWCRATRTRLDRVFSAAGFLADAPITVPTSEPYISILDDAIRVYEAKGWRVEVRGEHEAVIARERRLRHLLHLLITLLTFGLWLPVWIVLAVRARGERRLIAVDALGRLQERRL